MTGRIGLVGTDRLMYVDGTGRNAQPLAYPTAIHTRIELIISQGLAHSRLSTFDP